MSWRCRRRGAASVCRPAGEGERRRRLGRRFFLFFFFFGSGGAVVSSFPLCPLPAALPRRVLLCAASRPPRRNSRSKQCQTACPPWPAGRSGARLFLWKEEPGQTAPAVAAGASSSAAAVARRAAGAGPAEPRGRGLGRTSSAACRPARSPGGARGRGGGRPRP